MNAGILNQPNELTQPTKPAPEPPGRTHARKTCFAILDGTLGKNLVNAGLSPDMFWKAIQSEYSIESRTDLSEEQFVVIAARLSAAQRDNHLFEVLCGTIRASLGCGTVRVYSNDKKIYEGEFTDDIEQRCQQYADKTGVPVRLHGTDGADGIKWIKPTAEQPKPKPVVPKRKQAARAFEVHRNGLETHFIEVAFPCGDDLALWGQNHADATGYDVEITNAEKVVIMSFQSTPACAPMPVETEHDAECYLCATPIELPREMCADCEASEQTYDHVIDELQSAIRYLGKHRDGYNGKWLDNAQNAMKEAMRYTELLGSEGGSHA